VTVTVVSMPAFVAGVLLLATCLFGVGIVLGARVLSRDASILRARRRDAKRLHRARAREEASRQAKLRRAARGEHVGQVRVRNARPLPVQSQIPRPPGSKS